jgi:hypothetical protein
MITPNNMGAEAVTWPVSCVEFSVCGNLEQEVLIREET